MTLDEIQDALDGAGAQVSHMGWASRQARDQPATRWSVVIVPAQGSRWKRDEFRIRGIGPRLEDAFADALTRLSATVLTR